MAAFEHYSVLNDEQIPIMNGRSMEEEEVGKFIPTLEKKLKIEVIKLTEDEIVFDVIGVDVSIANTLRRILIAEVPTMAIETVWIAKNTSIIQVALLYRHPWHHPMIPVSYHIISISCFLAGRGAGSPHRPYPPKG
jgi:DNA-directed RNA polymerase subunit L